MKSIISSDASVFWRSIWLNHSIDADTIAHQPYGLFLEHNGCFHEFLLSYPNSGNNMLKPLNEKIWFYFQENKYSLTWQFFFPEHSWKPNSRGFRHNILKSFNMSSIGKIFFFNFFLINDLGPEWLLNCFFKKKVVNEHIYYDY